MNSQLLTGDDIRFLAQQPEYEVDVMVGQMTTLMQNITDLQQDTDDKVAKLESQNWFKRMCNTILGKNKATKQEIQKNGDKVITYISQSVAQLYNMNLINEKVLWSLGNRMNEVYMQVTTMYQEQLEMKAQISQIMTVQQQTLEAMGAFVSKLNEKIESVDNFHMLISEIQNGMYNDSSKLYNICMILSQLDKRQMDDSRKMNLLQDTMNRAGIITDDEITVLQCLQDIVALPQEKIGLIYMELCNFRNSFPANLFADMIEGYHFLSKMEKMSKKKDVLIQRVMDKYDLDADAAFPISVISDNFFENKQASLISLANIRQIDISNCIQKIPPDSTVNSETIQEPDVTTENTTTISDYITITRTGFEIDRQACYDYYENYDNLDNYVKQFIEEIEKALDTIESRSPNTPRKYKLTIKSVVPVFPSNDIPLKVYSRLKLIRTILDLIQDWDSPRANNFRHDHDIPFSSCFHITVTTYPVSILSRMLIKNVTELVNRGVAIEGTVIEGKLYSDDTVVIDTENDEIITVTSHMAMFNKLLDYAEENDDIHILLPGITEDQISGAEYLIKYAT